MLTLTVDFDLPKDTLLWKHSLKLHRKQDANSMQYLTHDV